MGLIKPNNYSLEEMNLFHFTSAISHPARQRIIMHIQSEIKITQNDLVKKLNLSQSTINKHLQFLQKACLLDNEYFLHFESLKINEKVFNTMLDRINMLNLKS